jgi:hypothetical protein
MGLGRAGYDSTNVPAALLVVPGADSAKRRMHRSKFLSPLSWSRSPQHADPARVDLGLVTRTRSVALQRAKFASRPESANAAFEIKFRIGVPRQQHYKRARLNRFGSWPDGALRGLRSTPM